MMMAFERDVSERGWDDTKMLRRWSCCRVCSKYSSHTIYLEQELKRGLQVPNAVPAVWIPLYFWFWSIRKPFFSPFALFLRLCLPEILGVFPFINIVTESTRTSPWNFLCTEISLMKFHHLLQVYLFEDFHLKRQLKLTHCRKQTLNYTYISLNYF